MLLRLSCSPTDWRRLAAALDAADSPILAGTVRALLAAAPRTDEAAPVPLAFTPQQAGELQRVAAGFGLALPATPVADERYLAGSATTPAERAEAVAAAAALLRPGQRQRVS